MTTTTSTTTITTRECNPGTRVPENPGNPPVFKPVNLGLCAGKNPGLTGLILVSVSTQYTAQKSVQKIRSRLSDATLDTWCFLRSYYRK